MRKSFITILIVFCIVTSKSQTFDRSVIASAGGYGKTSTFSLEWTLGELAAETMYSQGKVYTAGFNQPVLIVTPFAIKPDNSNYTISIAPNPVLSILNFSISSRKNKSVYITVSDMSGKTFMQRKLAPGSTNAKLDFAGLPAGTYTLFVREHPTAGVIKSYQIIRL